MLSIKLLETILCEIWKEVFKRQTISKEDHFFDLGGHSLNATRIAAMLRRQYKIDLPVNAIYEFPIVKDLADEIHKRHSNRNLFPPYQKAPRTGLHHLSFSQQRLWFLHELREDVPLYIMPIFYKVCGQMDLQLLQIALNLLVVRHEALRTKIVVIEGRPFQEILPESTPFPFEIRTNIERISEEILRPFDLSRDLLYRGIAGILSENEVILYFAFHHIIFDDWSRDVFCRELSELYCSLHHGATPSLSPLPMQYLDYALWQKKLLSDFFLEDQLSYWRECLKKCPSSPFPCDLQRPQLLQYRGASHRVSLPLETLQALKRFSSNHNVMPFIPLLAAFIGTLSLCTENDDIIVGSPISNRRFEEENDIIGFFVNTLVLRTSTAGNPDFEELVRRVKKTVLLAYEHQFVPFEKIVDEVVIERSINRNPLFQVMFSITYAEEITPLRLERTVVESFEAPNCFSKFDLSVHAMLRDDHIDLTFEYSTELYRSERIESFARSFIFVLQSTLDRCKLQLSQLASLGEEQKIPFIRVATQERNLSIPQPIETSLGSRTLEQDLKTIWKSLLYIEDVGMDENFFEIGGNSLLTVEMKNRIETSLSLPVKITDFFQYPTIRSFARHLTASYSFATVRQALMLRVEKQKKAQMKRKIMHVQEEADFLSE